MSRVCELTGKRPRAGQKRSHSMRATKRWFKPNIIRKWIRLEDGSKVRIKISAKAYKRLQKEWLI